MTDPHPFERNRVEAVADERGADDADLDAALAEIQDAIAREETDGQYEYSSQHNFGWRDDGSYFLYGDGIWDTLGDELSLSDSTVGTAREVHRRAMVAAAGERDERESVEKMLADGTEPLVVVDTASDPPLYGQDV